MLPGVLDLEQVDLGAGRVFRRALAAASTRASAATSALASSTERAPSATATIEKFVPAFTRRLIAVEMLATEYGISGMRMTSAPPARPDPRVSQPAPWPMISATMIRWWLCAVECSRSIASVAISSAVAKPIDASVPARSKSIVLGNVITSSPAFARRSAFFAVPPPPMHTSASRPAFW